MPKAVTVDVNIRGVMEDGGTSTFRTQEQTLTEAIIWLHTLSADLEMALDMEETHDTFLMQKLRGSKQGF